MRNGSGTVYVRFRNPVTGERSRAYGPFAGVLLTGHAIRPFGSGGRALAHATPGGGWRVLPDGHLWQDVEVVTAPE